MICSSVNRFRFMSPFREPTTIFLLGHVLVFGEQLNCPILQVLDQNLYTALEVLSQAAIGANISDEKGEHAQAESIEHVGTQKKGHQSDMDWWPKNLAASYSPTESPLQYHRPWRTLLPCSGWERVWPLRHCRQKLTLTHTANVHLSALEKN